MDSRRSLLFLQREYEVKYLCGEITYIYHYIEGFTWILFPERYLLTVVSKEKNNLTFWLRSPTISRYHSTLTALLR